MLLCINASFGLSPSPPPSDSSAVSIRPTLPPKTAAVIEITAASLISRSAGNTLKPANGEKRTAVSQAVAIVVTKPPVTAFRSHSGDRLSLGDRKWA